MAKRARGIRRHGAGWQTYVQVGGVTHWRTWPLDTPLETMQAWRHRMKGARAEARALARLARDETTLAQDIDAYLETRVGMPTYAERKRHLELWLAQLGDRPRGGITHLDIDAVLYRWRAEALAPQTIRLRRSALRALWYALDGKGAPNPVRGSWCPPVPKPATRTVTPAIITRVLAQLRPGTATHARLRVMATTGLPPAVLMQVTADDLDWRRRRVRVRPRRKGAGTAETWLPLSRPALDAFRALAAAQAWGAFSTSAVYARWQHACEKAGVKGVRPYDLRHAYGALVYRETGDLATVGRLLLHAQLGTTQRYAEAAAAALDAAAVTKVGQTWQKLASTSRNPARARSSGG